MTTMKKTLFSLVAFTTFLVGATATPAVAAGVPRIHNRPVELANPGFEDGTVNWNLPANAALDPTVAHGGRASAVLAVADPMKDGVYITRRIPIVGGGLYRADCFVKTENVTDRKGRMSSVGAGLIVEWSDKNGKWMAAGEYACGSFGTKDWHRATCAHLKAPDDAGYAQIYLALRGAGKAWFDDFTFTAIERTIDMHEPAADAAFACNTPRFTWGDLPGARTYTVELARDPSFPANATRTSPIPGVTFFQLKEPLDPGTWYWRAGAPGAQRAAARAFRQTAPKDRDCLPPDIRTVACRVTAANAPFTVVVQDDGATPPVVTCGAARGTCGAPGSNGVYAVTFAAPARGRSSRRTPPATARHAHSGS